MAPSGSTPQLLPVSFFNRHLWGHRINCLPAISSFKRQAAEWFLQRTKRKAEKEVRKGDD